MCLLRHALAMFIWPSWPTGSWLPAAGAALNYSCLVVCTADGCDCTALAMFFWPSWPPAAGAALSYSCSAVYTADSCIWAWQALVPSTVCLSIYLWIFTQTCEFALPPAQLCCVRTVLRLAANRANSCLPEQAAWAALSDREHAQAALHAVVCSVICFQQ